MLRYIPPVVKLHYHLTVEYSLQYMVNPVQFDKDNFFRIVIEPDGCFPTFLIHPLGNHFPSQDVCVLKKWSCTIATGLDDGAQSVPDDLFEHGFSFCHSLGMGSHIDTDRKRGVKVIMQDLYRRRYCEVKVSD